MNENNQKILKTEISHEKAVIKALLNNARKSSITIAKEIGLTRQTVSKIINKLEKDGRIWGYATVIEPELLGNHFYLVLLKFKEDIDKGELMKNISTSGTLIQFTEEYFRYSSYLHGKFDFMTSFYAPNIIEAEKKVNKMLRPFRKYISELYIHQVLITFRRMGIINPNITKEINEHF
ncbi:MAG: winged helix-turn-helix transcriptional regulator [Candidatus Thermoplasmatota archaeon]|nr:winged helix-turn-helix transcriptional regulator [Candidatus Thermoplasmatota archaeon]